MGKNFNKTEDLVLKVAELGNTTKTKAKESVDVVIDAIIELIKDETHDGLQIYGFETWEVKEKKAREYRNPQNGEPVLKNAENFVSSKLAKKIKKLEF